MRHLSWLERSSDRCFPSTGGYESILGKIQWISNTKSSLNHFRRVFRGHSTERTSHIHRDDSDILVIEYQSMFITLWDPLLA